MPVQAPVKGNVLDVALGAVGNYRYIWGGIGPPNNPGGFDCSGFVYWAFNQIGVPLQRAMASQLKQGSDVPLGPPGNRLMNAVPGDVVYFGLNNADPAKNHEGIITSTAGIGSMVNSACTACGPQPEIDAIGEGSSADEPISAIRRFVLGMPGTIAQQTPQPGVTTAADTNNPCDVKIPIVDVCIMYPSWRRAMLGGLFFAGSFALGVAGFTLLAMRAKFKVPTPIANTKVGRIAASPPENLRHYLVGPHVFYGDVPEATARGKGE